ncbi:hypothetical protein RHGRI_033284 [Rhododendron griersonianum]|uniref:Uncharacterized protein n=1 Tax=Rhododendron griersonianum TaxID=479676 RepID=A0AAV6HW51_9ERIC|nr:hypothetical protein RHGRI_033284 [Rhododendron griersonianum]
MGQAILHIQSPGMLHGLEQESLQASVRLVRALPSYGAPLAADGEAQALRALLHFLKMSRKPLASYVAALAKVAPNLKHSYESLDPVWEDDMHRRVLDDDDS